MKVASILEAKGERVVTTRPDVTVAAAVRELTANGIGALVVTEDGASVLGVISERDIVQALALHGPSTLGLPVSNVMTRRVVTCGPEDTVNLVMAEMTRHRVRHLPVLEGGRLRGVVSIGDVVKHRLDELESETSLLREFITRQ